MVPSSDLGVCGPDKYHEMLDEIVIEITSELQLSAKDPKDTGGKLSD